LRVAARLKLAISGTIRGLLKRIEEKEVRSVRSKKGKKMMTVGTTAAATAGTVSGTEEGRETRGRTGFSQTIF
jgi:hypothetical protein